MAASNRNTSGAKGSSAAAAASVIPILLASFGADAPTSPQAALTAPQAVAAAKKPGPTAACGTPCGTERWSIKTLSDTEASTVQMRPVPSSVHALMSEETPTTSSNDTRLNDVERQVFTVQARLVGYKIELDNGVGDHDFHIVLADPKTGETMIVEIPDPECKGVCNSIAKDQIAAARAEFLKAFPKNPPGPTFVVVDDPQPTVEVTGAGFYDFFHGQTGVGKNCVELHPVLNIKFPAPGTFAAQHDPSREPPKTPRSAHNCIPE